jgi:hypothetical protein
MQTLSEFYKTWRPGIVQQAKEIGAKVEAGQNMSRFLSLEPELRSEIDNLCLAYPEAMPSMPNIRNADVGYLFHLRLWQGCEFAQFLEHCGLGRAEMDASEWIGFLTVASWHQFPVHKWRYEFSMIYGGQHNGE